MAPAATMVGDTEGAMTDEDVHLSPSSVCGGGGGSRLKILCSFGGRIMARPSDGILKYVGGETRVLAVPRSIPFHELKNKVEEMFKTEVAAIKYQLVAEDIDVLVSVTCDGDLAHMLDEYDRLEAKRSPSASPRFRVYVFAPRSTTHSSATTAAFYSTRHAGHAWHRHFQAERYVETVPATPSGSPPYPVQQQGAVSAGNSPRAIASELASRGLNRVRSTPNLGSLDEQQHHHQHATDGGGLAGYRSGSPRHSGGGHLVFQGNSHQQCYFHHHHQQYTPPHAPVPVPVPMPVPHRVGLSGRYDTHGYTRGGYYYAPQAARPGGPPVRPGTRGGPPYSEMQTPRKATIWD